MINIFLVVLVITGTFIGAMATTLIKKGTNHYPIRKLFFKSILWLGLFLYGISVIFYIIALRQEELSIIYPLVSTSYIWATFFSVKYLGEKMNCWKWLALAGIIIGVSLIGLGS